MFFRVVVDKWFYVAHNRRRLIGRCYKLNFSITEVQPKSELYKWTDTNISEMYTLMNTFAYAACSKNNMYDNWCKDSLIGTPMFGTWSFPFITSSITWWYAVQN